MILTTDQIKLIYDWYCAAMRKEGYKIKPPKGTEFTKTYQYRALQIFAKRMNKSAFSEETIKAIVYAVVRYGKRNKLLNSKGVNILNMKSALQICEAELKSKDTAEAEIINAIKGCREHLLNKGFTSSVLLAKPMKLGAMSWIRYLIETGEMPLTYLAVSKTAAIALLKIERSNLPSDSDLMKIRAKLLLNNHIRSELKIILGSDLNTAGIPGSITC